MKPLIVIEGELRQVGTDEDGNPVAVLDFDCSATTSPIDLGNEEDAEALAPALYKRVRVTFELIKDDDEVGADLAEVLDDEAP